MRILYVIYITSVLATLLLWLGFFRMLSRKAAAGLAFVALAVGGGLLSQAVLPGNSFYGPVLARVKMQEKVMALTFDDGPCLPYTEQLLDVLYKENIKATFFIVGEKALQRPELVRKVEQAGHEIGLHSYVHRDQLKLPAEAVADNLAQGKAALEGITGVPTKFFRPPHGFKDWTVMAEAEKAHLEVVNWSLIPRDWTNPGAEVIAQRVIENVHPGAIVLLHDGDSSQYVASREQTIKATGKIIRELKQQGYRFVTVSELKRIGKS